MSRGMTGHKSLSTQVEQGSSRALHNEEDLMANHLIVLLLSALTIHMNLNLLPRYSQKQLSMEDNVFEFNLLFLSSSRSLHSFFQGQIKEKQLT